MLDICSQLWFNIRRFASNLFRANKNLTKIDKRDNDGFSIISTGEISIRLGTDS